MRSDMKVKARISFSVIIIIGIVFSIIVLSGVSCVDGGYNSKSTTEDDKHRGAHVFGIFDTTDLQFLARNNIEWVTQVAWAYQDDFNSPEIRHHNGDSVMMYKTDSTWISRIKKIRSAGFKVFVKPHTWVNYPSLGKWRAEIFPDSEEEWHQWKSSYRDYIFRYAKLAEKANAEMFCVGTEITSLSIGKPAFWKALILEVRSIYSGQLTYAANWYDEYERINFWEDLDYIGIQAYFPLAQNEYAGAEEISDGWEKHLSTIQTISKKYNRKVLFTEMGYKSTADSAIEPWRWVEYSDIEKKRISTQTQANCYKAFFDVVWDQEWFGGVHIWQYRVGYTGRDQDVNVDFTPQGKPAEKIITSGFSRMRE